MFNINQHGKNDLLEEAYRNLAREHSRMDWIVVGACLVAIVITQVFGS